jgi:hypothetical protein
VLRTAAGNETGPVELPVDGQQLPVPPQNPNPIVTIQNEGAASVA